MVEAIEEKKTNKSKAKKGAVKNGKKVSNFSICTAEARSNKPILQHIIA